MNLGIWGSRPLPCSAFLAVGAEAGEPHTVPPCLGELGRVSRKGSPRPAPTLLGFTRASENRKEREAHGVRPCRGTQQPSSDPLPTPSWPVLGQGRSETGPPCSVSDDAGPGGPPRAGLGAVCEATAAIAEGGAERQGPAGEALDTPLPPPLPHLQLHLRGPTLSPRGQAARPASTSWETPVPKASLTPQDPAGDSCPKPQFRPGLSRTSGPLAAPP